MNGENTLVLQRKKNELYAKNLYQYDRLATAKFYFVPCDIEETYDEVVFTYNLEGLMPFNEARDMRDGDKYGLLLQILEVLSASSEFTFLLNPGNLFFDQHKRIRIMERDICNQGTVSNHVEAIQALAGYLFQKTYTFENLQQGGISLLKKHNKTQYLLEIDSLEKARQDFQERQDKEREKERFQWLYVKRSSYIRNLWLLGITAAACIGMAGLLIYQKQWIIVPQSEALMAERAYMEQDYPAVVDALSRVPLDQMDKHEKYLLASVAIRGQSVDSFDNETRERLLSKLSYSGDEHLLDYWICLVRFEVDQALDIAMRMSDQQLTIYAYLQKIDLVSTDNSLSGEEKAQEINLLKGKVKTLADELGIEYKESTEDKTLAE